MLLDYIRKVVPIKYRQKLGLWTARKAGTSKWLFNPYFFILCGTIPKNLTLLPNDMCEVDYHGLHIKAPRDGILAFCEVLQDEVYEKVYKPKLGDVVIDIGAYVGMFSVKMAERVGLEGKVIAIEPAQPNIPILIQNTKYIPNIIVMTMAAGSRKGVAELSIARDSPCHTLIPREGDKQAVVIDSLDNILKGLKITKVDFIKIDAEGYELEILKGATETLKNNKVNLAVASYHELPNGEKEMPYINEFLLTAGYETRIIKDYIYAYRPD